VVGVRWRRLNLVGRAWVGWVRKSVGLGFGRKTRPNGKRAGLRRDGAELLVAIGENGKRQARLPDRQARVGCWWHATGLEVFGVGGPRASLECVWRRLRLTGWSPLPCPLFRKRLRPSGETCYGRRPGHLREPTFFEENQASTSGDFTLGRERGGSVNGGSRGGTRQPPRNVGRTSSKRRRDWRGSIPRQSRPCPRKPGLDAPVFRDSADGIRPVTSD